ncbi:MAG: hypothetical protein JWP04_3315 [Belnapia sp.]|nr:hypothetical protein [Belnapia sp.]
MNTGRRPGLAALATLVASSRPARAGAWPERPVRLVVPYAPGGANDILARLYGQRLGETFGQPFVVENRPGAQAIIGAALVARAVPDGHTLLLGASGPLVFNPAGYARLPYDPQTDFAPVSLLAAYPLAVVVPAAGPFRTLQDLLAFARIHPDSVTYGAGATSIQLPTELLNQRAGTRFQYVAYRGSAETVQAVAQGEVTMALVDAGPATLGHAAGRIRILAVTAPRRLPAWPECPTMGELDFPDLTIELWSGLLAPAATPPGIVARLAVAAAGITREASMRQRLLALSLQPLGSTPEQFRGIIAAELPLWAEVARKSGLRLG